MFGFKLISSAKHILPETIQAIKAKDIDFLMFINYSSSINED